MQSSGPVLSYGNSRNPRELTIDPLTWIEELLAVGGVDAALAFLNTRVEHRCSAVYKLSGDTLHMTHYYDASGGPPMAILETIPLGDSFCQFALRDGSFYVKESMEDQRVPHTSIRALVASYVGVPIVKADGSYIGTLCHFDIVERTVDEEEMDLQRRAADLISRSL